MTINHDRITSRRCEISTLNDAWRRTFDLDLWLLHRRFKPVGTGNCHDRPSFKFTTWPSAWKGRSLVADHLALPVAKTYTDATDRSERSEARPSRIASSNLCN